MSHVYVHASCPCLARFVDVIQNYQGRAHVIGIGFVHQLCPSTIAGIGLPMGHVLLTNVTPLKHNVPQEQEIKVAYPVGERKTSTILKQFRFTEAAAAQTATKVNMRTICAQYAHNMRTLCADWGAQCMSVACSRACVCVLVLMFVMLYVCRLVLWLFDLASSTPPVINSCASRMNTTLQLWQRRSGNQMNLRPASIVSNQTQ
jgi:hypothetical protein